MLVLRSAQPCLLEELEIDYHVPLVLRWAGPWSDAPAYFEYGDNLRAILEVRVDVQSGCVRAVKLIAGSACRRVTEELNLSGAIAGHPCCSLLGIAPLQKTHVPAELRVALGPNYVVVEVSDKESELTLAAGHAFFGFDGDGALNRIGVAGLDSDEVAALAEALSAGEASLGLPLGTPQPIPQ